MSLVEFQAQFYSGDRFDAPTTSACDYHSHCHQLLPSHVHNSTLSQSLWFHRKHRPIRDAVKTTSPAADRGDPSSNWKVHADRLRACVSYMTVIDSGHGMFSSL